MQPSESGNTDATDGFPRRTFLVGGGRVGVAAFAGAGLIQLLAACGDGDSSSTSSGTSDLTAEQIQAATGTINVLGWSFYDNKAWNSGKVTAKTTPISSAEELYAKLRPDDPPFDVAEPASNNMKQMFALDRVAPIDTSLLPNYEGLAEGLRDAPVWKGDDGQIYGIPITFIVALTAYDSASVPEPTTIADLRAAEYADKVGIFDAADILTGIAQVEGYLEDGDLTEASVDQAVEFLQQMRDSIRTFYTFGDEAQLLARGDIAVAYPTFGSVITGAQESRPSIKANLGGAYSQSDAFVVVPGADLPATYSWINNALSAKAGKEVSIVSGSYTAVEGATDTSVLPAPLDKMTVSEALAAAPFLVSVSPEPDGDLATNEYLQSAWEDLKASFG